MLVLSVRFVKRNKIRDDVSFNWVSLGSTTIIKLFSRSCNFERLKADTIWKDTERHNKSPEKIEEEREKPARRKICSPHDREIIAFMVENISSLVIPFGEWNWNTNERQRASRMIICFVL